MILLYTGQSPKWDFNKQGTLAAFYYLSQRHSFLSEDALY
jgi:hypothetical protein